MSKILAIVDISLCKTDIFFQVRELCRGGVDAIVLRLKNLDKDSYLKLSHKMNLLCSEFKVEFIVSNFLDIARELGASFWLSSSFIDNFKINDFQDICNFYAPAHSIDEARYSLKLGANFLVASHIFKTDSKQGIMPKGVSLIKSIKALSSVPVLALGGINLTNISQVKCADGICVMSDAMSAKDPFLYMQKLKRHLGNEILGRSSEK